MEPSLENYIELKTAYKKVDSLYPPRCEKLFPKWYLQSYLLGVPVLAVGYRNTRNHVYSIKRKHIKEVLREAQKYNPTFDCAVSLGRVHAIFSALLEHFRSLGQSVSAQDRFELHVYENGDALVEPSPTNPSKFVG